MLSTDLASPSGSRVQIVAHTGDKAGFTIYTNVQKQESALVQG